MVSSSKEYSSFPLVSSLPSELNALGTPYERIRQLDSDIRALWGQCISDQGTVVDKSIVKDIKVLEKDLNENIKEIKFLVEAILSDDNAEENSREFALHMMSREIAYLDGLRVALRMQLEEVLDPSMDSLEPPIDFAHPKVELEKITQMKKGQKTQRETIFKKMIEHQFERDWVLGDGNCLFRSIVRVADEDLFDKDYEGTLQRNDKMEGKVALDLRKEVVDYMQKNPEDFAAFCVIHPATGKETTFDLYLAAMKKSGTFGDNQELRALAAIKQKTIYVYKLGCVEVGEDNRLVPMPQYRFGEEFKDDGVIHLYLAHQHYTPLKEKALD